IAEMRSIEPDIAIHIDAFEPEFRSSILRNRRPVERATIPADAATRPASRDLAFALIGIEWACAKRVSSLAPDASIAISDGRQILDAPVMRNVEGAPGGVVVGGSFSPGDVAAVKAPCVIEGEQPRFEEI